MRAMPDGDLLTTGAAAKGISVAHSTLARWWKNGVVTPALVTAGGHARWDLDELKEQLRQIRASDQAD